VTSDIHVQVEVKTLLSRKDKLQNYLDALRKDDNRNMDDEVVDCYQDGD